VSEHEVRRLWTLEPEPAEVPRVRREVSRFVAELDGLPAARMPDLDLAVSEAVTNALVHGNRGGLREPVTVDVLVNGVVQVVVRDHGVGMSPHPDSPGAGLGLAILGKLADRMELRAADGGGTELRIAFEPR
jgi:anti-sigma regulatory factor (Ser/Thr protein kinase)